MARWKLALLFLLGFAAGAIAWGVSDLAVMDWRGETDLTAEEIPTTEMYDDQPVRETRFSELSHEERDKFFPIWGKAFFGVQNLSLIHI